MEGRGLFVLFIFRRAVPFWARILNRTWLFVWPWHHDWQASGQDNTEAQRHGQSAKCSKILKLYSSRCAMSRNASDVSVFSLHYFYIFFFFLCTHMWGRILILRDWHATIAVCVGCGPLPYWKIKWFESKHSALVSGWVGDFGAAFLLFPISIANSFAVYRAEIIP